MFLKNTRKSNFFIISLLVVFISLTLVAEGKKSRKQYEKEKKELLRKIQDADVILKDTRNEIKASEGELRALNQQIYTRRRYIKSLEKEIDFLNEDILSLNDITKSLQRDIDTLKAEYSHMIYAAYKVNNNYNTWIFIFSSESYNQLMMRLHYLKEFNKMRQKQVIKINQVKEYLEEKKSTIQLKFEKKQKTLAKIEKEQKELTAIKSSKRNVLSSLTEREQEFLSKRKKWKKEQEKLEILIKQSIALELSKGQKAISKRFEAKKRKLPKPLKRCFIARKFGKQPHPFLEKIYVNNMGVGLQTQKNAKAYSVFEGKVTTVASIPGMHKVVMVQHGEYFTVYAKLKTTNVKVGQTILANHVIGTVFTSNDGETELEFQIWKGKNRLNPEKWLRK
ncbi:MAG: peptidoglycan DD-metalloendopeptidase family protein [Cytophagales bacterium]|nr:peptidoglycan DD-metalloendopeptidase family protein [Cytophagales bacterium]